MEIRDYLVKGALACLLTLTPSFLMGSCAEKKQPSIHAVERTLDERVENEVYDFAKKLSEKRPSGFVEQTYGDSSAYHDKSLDLKDEDEMYVQGKGRLAVNQENENIFVADMSVPNRTKEPKAENLKMVFGYIDYDERIVLAKPPMVIAYVQEEEGMWKRHFGNVEDFDDTQMMITINSEDPIVADEQTNITFFNYSQDHPSFNNGPLPCIGPFNKYDYITNQKNSNYPKQSSVLHSLKEVMGIVGKFVSTST